MKYQVYLQNKGLSLNPAIPPLAKAFLKRLQKTNKPGLLLICRDSEIDVSGGPTKPELIHRIMSFTVQTTPLCIQSTKGPGAPASKPERTQAEPPENAPQIQCECCEGFFPNWEVDLVATSWAGHYANYCRKCNAIYRYPSFEQSRISVSLNTHKLASL